MVFLVGAPRSGTNWLQRMLGAHPDVVYLPSETHLFSYGLRRLDEQVQHGLLTSPATGKVYLEREEWVRAMREFCVLVYGRVADSIDPSARLVVERSPTHVLHLQLIGEVFPDAAVVHIVRDGRDVARSIARQVWAPDDVRAAAEQWRDAIIAGRAAAPLLARYREVRYEQLMGDPRRQLAELYGWLGIAADDRVLDDVALTADTPFNVDPASPEVGIGKWRTEWNAAQLRAFDEIAGDVRRDLGYDDAALVRRPLRSRRLRSSLRGLRPSRPPAAASVSTPVVTAHEVMQITVDEFLADAASGRLPDGLADDVSVSCTGPDGRWQAQGRDAVARLADALGAEGPWGRQVHGTEQIVGRTVVATLTHESPTGERSHRVVVLGFAPSGAIAHVGYTRLAA